MNENLQSTAARTGHWELLAAAIRQFNGAPDTSALAIRAVEQMSAVLECERAAISILGPHGMIHASADPQGNLTVSQSEEELFEEDRLADSLQSYLQEPSAILPLTVQFNTTGLIAFSQPRRPSLEFEEAVELARVLAEALALGLTQTLEAEHHQRQVQMQVEEALARTGNEQLQLSTLAHDLRLPLMTVSMGAKVLKRKIDPSLKEAHYLLGEIHVAAHHMLRMASNLLEAGKLSLGFGSVECQMASLQSTVDDAVELVRPALSLRCMILEMDLPGDVQCWMDPLRVRQILINLLDNAIKFSPEGSQIHLWISPPDTAPHVLLNVEDQGPGINPELTESIFCPYVRMAEDQMDLPGAGLGLAISRQYARKMGGDITVQSEIGKGATFTLALPCTEEDQRAADA